MGCLGLQKALIQVRKTERGFTLIELIVVLAIVLVLSSIAMYLHQRGLAHARKTVCQTNLRALQTAIELYVAENGDLPGTLTHLKLEHLEKAYAKAIKDRGWLIKAYTFLIKLDESDHAYAQFLTYENLKEYGATEKIFHCPADHNGGASYGMNSDIEGEMWADVGEDVILIGDSDNYIFNTTDQLTKRHKSKAFAISKSGEIVEVKGGKALAVGRSREITGKDYDEQSRGQWRHHHDDGDVYR